MNSKCKNDSHLKIVRQAPEIQYNCGYQQYWIMACNLDGILYGLIFLWFQNAIIIIITVKLI